MRINTFKINSEDRKIITDIDDCLILTSDSLKKQKIDKKIFWFNRVVYNKHKRDVFQGASLSSWGEEFRELIQGGFSNYLMITSAYNRASILCDIFGVERLNIRERVPDQQKINYLNRLEEDAIYIDDKRIVINRIRNKRIQVIQYNGKEKR